MLNKMLEDRIKAEFEVYWRNKVGNKDLAYKAFAAGITFGLGWLGTIANDLNNEATIQCHKGLEND
jgi:hypothetical protein